MRAASDSLRYRMLSLEQYGDPLTGNCFLSSLSRRKSWALLFVLQARQFPTVPYLAPPEATNHFVSSRPRDHACVLPLHTIVRAVLAYPLCVATGRVTPEPGCGTAPSASALAPLHPSSSSTSLLARCTQRVRFPAPPPRCADVRAARVWLWGATPHCPPAWHDSRDAQCTGHPPLSACAHPGLGEPLPPMRSVLLGPAGLHPACQEPRRPRGASHRRCVRELARVRSARGELRQTLDRPGKPVL